MASQIKQASLLNNITMNQNNKVTYGTIYHTPTYQPSGTQNATHGIDIQNLFTMFAYDLLR
jgi:hypothetical protein